MSKSSVGLTAISFLVASLVAHPALSHAEDSSFTAADNLVSAEVLGTETLRDEIAAPSQTELSIAEEDPAEAVPVALSQLTVMRPEDRPADAEFNDDRFRQRIDYFNQRHGDDRIVEIQATSPSMNNRSIPLVVIKAKDPNRPILYLLNGAGGGEQRVTWVSNTQALDFYWKKNINVVIPMRGAFSYYVDWLKEPQGDTYLKGPQRWETFLTKELPGPLEAELEADSQRRGIVGMSMSATSSLLLAERNPDFYDVVGSYSGCAATSKPLPALWAQFTVNRDGESPASIWGPLGSERNKAHDALIQAPGLRDKTIYISNGSGLVSASEVFSSFVNSKTSTPEQSTEALGGSAEVTVSGGVIEAATNSCTHDLKAKLDHLGIPATYNFRNTGVHTWSYWVRDMEDSWPTYAKGFGIDNEEVLPHAFRMRATDEDSNTDSDENLAPSETRSTLTEADLNQLPFE
ncbi:esterase family protein [Corynebacterium sp. ES2794-CONJ1]|uniref:alpha/beta hydrolase n=1 Tax=unclassified Corynebacterium TaxID=2624378 RepID=UPI0021686209|nr:MULTISPECIES: alpha/beta hydrolase family protein [unclassified Corynebacterium]MCS4489803.1 esterase family protein [Corynebacterium sp. ES2775-CONJ]MCS4491833.1 esterase family protein [Corynebacterium sp. ES2715-CONJ3]MCU9519339.1 esterase family protein [Corynebacterium sp. ES2794-CONJ1]